MSNRKELKTAIIEFEKDFDYVNKYGEHINQIAVPSVFVGYEDNCPSCDGAGDIVCQDGEGNYENYEERCDYCDGKGYIDCKCGNDANFTTEEGWFCWDCLDEKHRKAFLKENPAYVEKIARRCD